MQVREMNEEASVKIPIIHCPSVDTEAIETGRQGRQGRQSMSEISVSA